MGEAVRTTSQPLELPQCQLVPHAATPRVPVLNSASEPLDVCVCVCVCMYMCVREGARESRSGRCECGVLDECGGLEMPRVLLVPTRTSALTLSFGL